MKFTDLEGSVIVSIKPEPINKVRKELKEQYEAFVDTYFPNNGHFEFDILKFDSVEDINGELIEKMNIDDESWELFGETLEFSITKDNYPYKFNNIIGNKLKTAFDLFDKLQELESYDSESEMLAAEVEGIDVRYGVIVADIENWTHEMLYEENRDVVDQLPSYIKDNIDWDECVKDYLKELEYTELPNGEFWVN